MLIICILKIEVGGGGWGLWAGKVLRVIKVLKVAKAPKVPKALKVAKVVEVAGGVSKAATLQSSCPVSAVFTLKYVSPLPV